MQINLIDHIKKSVEINLTEESILKSYIKVNTFKKNEELLANGQICRSMYFVEQGCLRMFFFNSKGMEQITQFAIEGWWLTDFSSFMQKQASDYYIHSIEPSIISSIDGQSFDDLLKKLPQLERYFRIVMQKNVAAAQRRSKYLYEMSKEEFYFHFSTSFPEFMQRVPQYMIASYLGLTPEYVSQLRKKQ